MDLTFLQPLYDRPSPMASLFINTSRDTEDADHAIRVRWGQARTALLEKGAPEETVAAMDSVVGRTRGVPGAHGQVVYAAGDEVVFDSTVARPPQDFQTSVGDLPDPLPYMVAEPRRVPHVLVVADSVGADLTVEYADGRTEVTRVEGDDKPVHKVREGGYHHNQMQRAVDEQVGQNANLVADTVAERAAASGAEVIALAGEVQVRGAIAERFPGKLRERVEYLEAGARSAGAENSPLEEELDEKLDARAAEHVREAVGAFGRGRADGTAVEGMATVLHALQRGQVETLLWNDELPGADRELHIGESGEQVALTERELRDMGVSGSRAEPARSAVLRAVVTTGAGLELVPTDAAELDEGIGAVLRFAAQS
ncbi:Vms1/Ankzf1 family peptidyl-tRNA hydrolase [Nocardiopsis sp. L17-MgMaSL7]|uniref:baeRF2 domain-containing protein n=1 Tax=Nocardiopsis sp. L17-MgMaSL7 TaxID=1938893 RepID=UPI000D71671B|nr:Vms1/Ankzf1 family peptidyl-tRNA hydrolase [Nocardiopsis sp. L17-MgMaSL7]PWV44443.1 hypothetical protein BDW27_12542 [Nocardiopsis sp. L17-MgMaSL7]